MERAGIGSSVEGTHAVAAALEAGRVTGLVVERGRMERPPLASMVARAEASGVTVEIVDDVRPLATTSAPQGVLATAHPLPTSSVTELVGREDPPAIVVLDRVEDPRNLGAVVRSMAAAGIFCLVVAGRRAAPISASALKAAAGAFERMSIAVVNSIASAVADMQQRGLWAVGLDADGERSLFGMDLLAEPIALVVGAEGSGLSRLVRERVDTVARIPIDPSTESLNVSAAATLAVFELARMRGRIT